MKRILFMLLAVAVVAAAAHAAEGHDGHAAVQAAPTVTLEGEIVDITCYLRHESSGPKHIKCATFCADQAMPFGFLVAGTGRLYLLLPDGHADPTKDLRQHFGQKVQVTGVLTEGNDLTGLQIDTVKAL